MTVSFIASAQRALSFAGLSLCLGLSVPAQAVEAKTRTDPLPKRLENIDVKEHLGESLPLELTFLDEQGKRVRLADYFDGKRPVIVTMNYSDCPMLCSLQLNAFVEGLKQIDWAPGSEFEIVTVSFDPEESVERAKRTQTRYINQYGRSDASSGWHFLTGDETNIRALADALGIQYGYNEKRDEYVHPAVIAIATPKGQIARYLYGLEYHPKTLRLSLVEASEGTIGSTIDRLILYCFHYDSSEGRYAPVALNIMRLGGGVALLGLAGFLAFLWRGEIKQRKLAESTAS